MIPKLGKKSHNFLTVRKEQFFLSGLIFYYLVTCYGKSQPSKLWLFWPVGFIGFVQFVIVYFNPWVCLSWLNGINAQMQFITVHAREVKLVLIRQSYYSTFTSERMITIL